MTRLAPRSDERGDAGDARHGVHHLRRECRLKHHRGADRDCRPACAPKNVRPAPHDLGECEQENGDGKSPAARHRRARVATAADTISATYPADEIVTYFLTLLLQDAAVWGGLVPWLVTRAGVRSS